jgi:hypothetical protein
MKRRLLFQLFALGAFALSSGCDTRSPTVPSFQPQIINLPNDFGLQVSALDVVTQDVQYTWQNDGSATTVTQSPTNLTGTALLFITDGAGVQVYQRSLAENGTFMTSAGAPGSWTVHIHLAEASGALTLRLKHP